MRKVKRIMSMLMVIVMIITLCPTSVQAADGTVYQVKDASELANALGSYASGDTIMLTDNIDYFSNILVFIKSITFDLNGFNLNVNNASGAGMTVSGGATSNLIGIGELNVTGFYGLSVQSGSNATVTNISASGNGCIGLDIWGGGSAQVLGDITANGSKCYGVCNSSSNVTVNGSISVIGSGGNGVYALLGGIVTVGGNVSSEDNVEDYDYNYGVQTAAAGRVEVVSGSATAIGNQCVAVLARGANSYIKVEEANANGVDSSAVRADNMGKVEVLGDAIASGDYCTGISFRPSSGNVTVSGNVYATGSYCSGIDASNGFLTVIGDVIASGSLRCKGARLYGGTYEVHGDIKAEGSLNYGVVAGAGTTLIVHGMISASQYYIEISPNIITKAEGIRGQSPYEYYLKYNKDTINIYVAIPTNDISVQSDTNGIASSNFSKMIKSETVTLSATPNNYYHFKEWQVINPVGGLSIINNTFTMPEEAVTVKAIFEKNPSYGITLQNDGNGTAAADHASAMNGETVTLSATPNKFYHFKEWQVINPVGGLSITSNMFTMPEEAVTVKAVFEKNPSYAITLQDDGNGTAAADLTSAMKGETVNLTATPASYYIFKEWQIISPAGITVTENSLVMPEEAVTIKAIFEQKHCTVTFSNNAVTYDTKIVKANTSVLNSSWPVDPTRSGYTFNGWYDSLSANGLGTKITTATNIIDNITVYATWNIIESSTSAPGSPSGGSSSVGGGGGNPSGGSGPTPTPTPNATPTAIPRNTQTGSPMVATVEVIATVANNGLATVTIPDAAIENAITEALAQANQQSSTTNGIGIVINVNAPDTADSLGIVLTQSTLQSLINSQAQSLEVGGRQVSVNFDAQTLLEMQRQSTGNVTFTITPVQSLSDTASVLIGTRPVYEMTISYAVNGQTGTVSNMNQGDVTIHIPYTPAAGENSSNLYASYVDGDGRISLIMNSTYDADSHSIIFTTNHFSVYGVAYQPSDIKFTDTKKHWAKESIDFVVSRGILSGTSGNTFSPDLAITRGELAAALGKLAGADVSSYKTSSFTDVKTGSKDQPYIEWVSKAGIIPELESKKFAQDKVVTREEVSVILAAYAQFTGFNLPITREAVTFTDKSSISSLAKEAVKAMQQAGIMAGEKNNKFNPKNSITRSEFAAVLQRYINVDINPYSAQGWARDDDGQRLFFKEGKALTGWKTLEGKKYYFNSTGILQTGWKIDGTNKYYLTTSGTKVGWQKIKNISYYFNKDGIMVSGKWQKIDKKWYYFYQDGSLAVSTTVDGYKVNSKGVR